VPRPAAGQRRGSGPRRDGLRLHALHVASANGETGVVELLLGHGADASIRSTRAFFDAPPGSTALSLARTARGPNHARVVALLEGGGTAAATARAPPAAAAASSAPAEP
jgi:hypothetical protein